MGFNHPLSPFPRNSEISVSMKSLCLFRLYHWLYKTPVNFRSFSEDKERPDQAISEFLIFCEFYFLVSKFRLTIFILNTTGYHIRS